MALTRIYEAEAYHKASLDGCYWLSTEPGDEHYETLQDVQQTGFAVIGSGYTGLNAALHLVQQGAQVTVLDLHEPGWGASGRNGGFCCLGGSNISKESIGKRYGEAELAQYCQGEKAAIDYVRQLIEQYQWNVDQHSNAGEIILAHRPAVMKALYREAEKIRSHYGVEPLMVEAKNLAEQGLAGQGFYGGLLNPLGFALNPRKYILSLARQLKKQGLTIYTNSPAQAIQYQSGSYSIQTPSGSLKAKAVLLATNGYSSENLPEWMKARYLPVQSAVMVTRPLTDAEIQNQGWHSDLMAYDSRQLLHYFRLMPDRRFLFGMRGSIAWKAKGHDKIKHTIRQHFESIFPAWKQVESTHFWSGLLNMTRDRVPFLGQIEPGPNAYAAFGYHGNGVAMGSWAGAQMARLALGESTDFPHFYQIPRKRFELGGFRRLSLYALYPLLYLLDGKPL